MAVSRPTASSSLSEAQSSPVLRRCFLDGHPGLVTDGNDGFESSRGRKCQRQDDIEGQKANVSAPVALMAGPAAASASSTMMWKAPAETCLAEVQCSSR